MNNKTLRVVSEIPTEDILETIMHTPSHEEVVAFILQLDFQSADLGVTTEVIVRLMRSLKDDCEFPTSMDEVIEMFQKVCADEIGE